MSSGTVWLVTEQFDNQDWSFGMVHSRGMHGVVNIISQLVPGKESEVEFIFFTADFT